MQSSEAFSSVDITKDGKKMALASETENLVYIYSIIGNEFKYQQTIIPRTTSPINSVSFDKYGYYLIVNSNRFFKYVNDEKDPANPYSLVQ